MEKICKEIQAQTNFCELLPPLQKVNASEWLLISGKEENICRKCSKRNEYRILNESYHIQTIAEFKVQWGQKILTIRTIRLLSK